MPNLSSLSLWAVHWNLPISNAALAAPFPNLKCHSDSSIFCPSQNSTQMYISDILYQNKKRYNPRFWPEKITKFALQIFLLFSCCTPSLVTCLVFDPWWLAATVIRYRPKCTSHVDWITRFYHIGVEREKPYSSGIAWTFLFFIFVFNQKEMYIPDMVRFAHFQFQYPRNLQMWQCNNVITSLL